jgi:hypothetical protein
MLPISSSLLRHFKGFCSSPSMIMLFIYMKCWFLLIFYHEPEETKTRKSLFRRAFKENKQPEKVAIDKK